MAKYWKDKRGEPTVSYWYYSVEIFDITYSFIKVEELRQFRDKVATRKLNSFRNWLGEEMFPLHLRDFFSKNGFSFLKFRLRESYLHFRHREEIVSVFDQAYEQFHDEQDNEEVECQTPNSRDWRQP